MTIFAFLNFSALTIIPWQTPNVEPNHRTRGFKYVSAKKIAISNCARARIKNFEVTYCKDLWQSFQN
jgi:hypothetical protein